MAGESNSKTTATGEKSLASLGTDDRLSNWLLFSFVLHGVILIGLIFSPYFPSGTRPAPPVYTVDLVGGEKIGGNRPGTELYPATSAKDAPKKVNSEPAAPGPEIKQPKPKLQEKSEKAVKADPPKPEKSEKLEKREKIVKPSEKPAPVEDKLAVKSTPPKKEEAKKEEPKKEPIKESPSKESSQAQDSKEMKSTAAPNEGAMDKVRERLIQSALDRVKSRAESTQKAAGSAKGGDVLSVGPGEGDGAAALGLGGRGGGSAVRGAEFFMYQAKIVNTIKENWAWPGQKGSLKALVRFSIKDSGEITGLKIAEPSGDPAFDESILRALRKSSPLPPPPETYRKDFAQVEMNFQP
jgi:colicin import membrane protein